MLWWFLPSDVALYLWCWNEWTLLKWSLLWIYTCTSWQEDPREPMNLQQSFTIQRSGTALTPSTGCGKEVRPSFTSDGEEQLTEIHLTPLHIILKSDFLHQRLDKSEQDWKPGWSWWLRTRSWGRWGDFILELGFDIFTFSSFFNRCFTICISVHCNLASFEGYSPLPAACSAPFWQV